MSPRFHWISEIKKKKKLLGYHSKLFKKYKYCTKSYITILKYTPSNNCEQWDRRKRKTSKNNPIRAEIPPGPGWGLRLLGVGTEDRTEPPRRRSRFEFFFAASGGPVRRCSPGLYPAAASVWSAGSWKPPRPRGRGSATCSSVHTDTCWPGRRVQRPGRIYCSSTRRSRQTGSTAVKTDGSWKAGNWCWRLTCFHRCRLSRVNKSPQSVRNPVW